MRLITSLFFFLLLGTAIVSAQTTPGSSVMMQGFNWVSSSNTTGWYNVVSSKAGELQAAGFNAVWLPPPSNSGATQGYLPRELYNVNSSYGTQAQLTSCISTLHNNGIKAIADIVINHRVGNTGWGDFQNPTWGCWSITNNDEWAQNGGNPCGAGDTGEPYSAARDLDHTNSTVRTDIKAWMNWLKNTIGFDGWRYDYAKGFSPIYFKEYNDATFPWFSVGECWDPDRQVIQNWIDGTLQSSTAFDFSTKGLLHTAVSGNYAVLSNNGQAAGLIGWSPSKAVTFLDNHDTGSTQNYWPFPGNKVMIGYAYILTHPGIPMVFWDHYFDWGGLKTPINELIAIRKANGINAGSGLNIQAASTNLYAAIIDNKVAMKIGLDNWSPSGTGWILKTYGIDYAVWDKLSSCATTAPTLAASPVAPATFTAASTPVTITASACNGVASTLYYTTNGSTPTASSPSATGSVTINITATTTIKVYAQNGTSPASAVQSYTYTVTSGCGTPVLTASPTAPATFTAATPISITATSCNGATSTIYYTTNGTTPSYSSPSVQGVLNLNISTTTTVKAFAKNTQGQNSIVQTYVYTVSTQCAAPTVTASPAAPYSSTIAFNVTLTASSCNNIASTMFYTTNGSTPTTSSPVYSSPIPIAQTTTLKVLARNSQGLFSAVQTYQYNIVTGGFTVYFKKPASWSAAKIHYWNVTPAGAMTATTWPGVAMSVDNSYSTCGWYKFTFPSTVTSSSIIFTDGTNQTLDLTRSSNGWFENNAWSSTDTRPAGGCPCPVPTFTSLPVAPATFTAASTPVTISASACNGAASTIYYTTNGTTPTTSSTSAVGSFTLNIAATTTVKAMAVNSQGLSSTVQSFVYTVIPACATPTLAASPAAPATFMAAITPVTLTASACNGTASTIYYTTNGSIPTTASASGVGSVTVNITATTTIKAFAMNNQGASSAVQSYTYTVSTPCVTPTLTANPPAPTTFTATSTPVTLTASTCNSLPSTIYYTTNGSTPTTASANASGSVTINITATTTIKAFAKNTQGQSSAVQSYTYTVTPPNGGFTVYFKKPANWSTAKIHYWNVSPSGALSNTTFPGITMTVDAAYSACGWYKFTFPSTVTSTSLLFTDGSNQTIDLTRSSNGWYDNGTWYNTDPRPSGGCPFVLDGNLDAGVPSLASNGGINLYVKYNGAQLYLATQSAPALGKDVFIFVSPNPGAMTAAPWLKTGQVAGNNIYLGNESTSNYNAWAGTTTAIAASSSGTYLEGTINLAALYGTVPQLIRIAVGRYGTTDGGTLSVQCPAAVTANGNIEAAEFVTFTVW